ncbi:hypothetical protein, partial [Pseudomonas syringae]
WLAENSNFIKNLGCRSWVSYFENSTLVAWWYYSLSKLNVGFAGELFPIVLVAYSRSFFKRLILE